MPSYYAAVFSDLEQHSLLWSRTSREQMAAAIAEYRYLAEGLADGHGSVHFNFTGDGHLFLFEEADSAVQFGLRLLQRWTSARTSAPALAALPPMPMRVGCHYGDCMRMQAGDAWIGRAINLSKRVEEAAQPDTLYVTEAVLGLIDLPSYACEPAGDHELKGDHMPRRQLYRLAASDVPVFANKTPDTWTAEDWFLKGTTTQDTDLEQQEKCYRQALRLRPDYPEAYNNLGIVLARKGNAESSGEHYRMALKARPDYAEAHYNYALLLDTMRSVGGALEHCREALRLRPDYADAHHAYANLLKKRGSSAEARKHYDAALALRPAWAELHNNYAVFLDACGEFDAAEQHFAEAFRLRPDYREAHYNFGLFLEDRGRAEQAEAHYRAAVRLWPDFVEAHNNLAILLHRRGDLDGACKHYQAALAQRPNDPEAHYNFALVLNAQGRNDDASEHFRIARDLAPDEPRFRSTLEFPQ